MILIGFDFAGLLGLYVDLSIVYYIRVSLNTAGTLPTLRPHLFNY